MILYMKKEQVLYAMHALKIVQQTRFLAILSLSLFAFTLTLTLATCKQFSMHTSTIHAHSFTHTEHNLQQFFCSFCLSLSLSLSHFLCNFLFYINLNGMEKLWITIHN